MEGAEEKMPGTEKGHKRIEIPVKGELQQVTAHGFGLSGHLFRKKRWNRWYVHGKDAVFTIAISDMDYLGFVTALFMDTKSGQTAERTISIPFGRNIYLGDAADSHGSFQNDNVDVQFMKEGGNFAISLTWLSFDGKKDLCTELSIAAPKRNESLNAIIPGRGSDLFRFTSKQNCLSAQGFLSLGSRRYEFSPTESMAFLDFTRGVYPFRTGWIRGSFSGLSGRDNVGFNASASQDDCREMTENALWLNGTISKIDEQVIFSRDSANLLKPWTLHTDHSDAVDLVFTPSAGKVSGFRRGIINYSAHLLFGKYKGMVKSGRKKIEIRNLPGWCEAHTARW